MNGAKADFSIFSGTWWPRRVKFFAKKSEKLTLFLVLVLAG